MFLAVWFCLQDHEIQNGPVVYSSALKKWQLRQQSNLMSFGGLCVNMLYIVSNLESPQTVWSHRGIYMEQWDYKAGRDFLDTQTPDMIQIWISGKS